MSASIVPTSPPSISCTKLPSSPSAGSGSDAPIVIPYRSSTHRHRQKCTRLDAPLPRERVRSMPHSRPLPTVDKPAQLVESRHSSSLSEVGLESHNPYQASDREAGDETPESHNGSRWPT